MGKLRPAALLLPGLLLSCSTVPNTDPLEAKAQTGDPVAVCQLIARDLHACAQERNAWEETPSNPSPACFSDMIDDRQEGYLEAAKAGIESRHQSSLPLMLQEISLRTAAILVLVGPSEKALERTAQLEQECTELSKYAK
jgi:hypothetical protein